MASRTTTPTVAASVSSSKSMDVLWDQLHESIEWENKDEIKDATTALVKASSGLTSQQITDCINRVPTTSRITFKGVRVTAKRPLLLCAVTSNKPKMVQLLLEHKADANQKGVGVGGTVVAPLFAALTIQPNNPTSQQHKDMEAIIHSLIAAGASPIDEMNRSPTIAANSVISHSPLTYMELALKIDRDGSLVRSLIEAKADAKYTRVGGRSPLEDAIEGWNVNAIRAIHEATGDRPSHEKLYSLVHTIRTEKNTKPAILACVNYMVNDMKMGWHASNDQLTPVFNALIHRGMCATLHFGIRKLLDMGAPIQPALIRAVDAMDEPCIRLLLTHRNMSRPKEVNWEWRHPANNLGWLGNVIYSSYVSNRLGTPAAAILDLLMNAGVSSLEQDHKGEMLIVSMHNVVPNTCHRPRQARVALPRLMAPFQRRLALTTIQLFAMGTHSVAGAESEIFRSLRSNPLYGPQILLLIHSALCHQYGVDMISPTGTTLRDPWKDPPTERTV